MKVTREDIAAFADGELSGEREALVAAAIDADPDLAAQLAAHRALKARLSAHFAPIAEQQVPDRLAALLAPREAEVVDFAAARERREARRALPRWSWVAGPALAASLALVLFTPRSDEVPAGYADAQLAAALDSQLSGPAAQGETRILLSFRDGEGDFCRAFSGTAGGGIACREDAGWKLEAKGAGSGAQQGDYRMAGASDGDILARAQDMAKGPALSAAEEAHARSNHWRGSH